LETIYKIDSGIFLYLNKFVGQSDLLDRFSEFVVNDYFVPVLSSMILLSIWFGWKTEEQRDRHQFGVMTAGLGVAIANSIVPILTILYFRERPFEVLDVNLLFYQPTDSSFPSNPACIIFAMAWGISFGNTRASHILFGFGFIYGLARVYSGVCYPMDVLGGLIVGLSSASAAAYSIKMANPLRKKFLQVTRFFCLS
jgi:undecaprenyl-diphosphatase